MLHLEGGGAEWGGAGGSWRGSVSKAGGGGSASWGKGVPGRLGWQLWGEDLKVPRGARGAVRRPRVGGRWQEMSSEDEVGTGCRLWGGGECDLTPVFAASLWPQAWRPGPCLWSHSLRREGAPGLLRAGWQRLPFFLQHVPVVITVVPVTVSLVAQASLSEVF